MYSSDEEDVSDIVNAMGPGAVDKQLREVMHLCWLSLPKNRRSIDELQKQMRSLVDRAIKDWQEDSARFQ